MGIFTGGDLQIECETEQKDGHLLCRGKRGKAEGAVLMRASKDGLSIVRQKGDVTIVDELIRHMESRTRVKTKSDI